MSTHNKISFRQLPTCYGIANTSVFLLRTLLGISCFSVWTVADKKFCEEDLGGLIYRMKQMCYIKSDPSKQMTQSSAAEFCRKNENILGDLPGPTSYADLEMIQKLSEGKAVWGNMRLDGGNWSYVDGKPVNWLNEDENAKDPSKPCVILDGKDSYRTSECDKTAAVICMRPMCDNTYGYQCKEKCADGCEGRCHELDGSCEGAGRWVLIGAMIVLLVAMAVLLYFG